MKVKLTADVTTIGRWAQMLSRMGIATQEFPTPIAPGSTLGDFDLYCEVQNLPLSLEIK